MRQQLLPLILCLFTAFSVFSHASINNIEVENNPIKSANYKLFTDFTANEFGLNFNSAYTSENSIDITTSTGHLYYFSGNYNSTGISSNKEISNKLLDDLTPSIANLSAIHVESNLFNKGLFYGFAFTIILLNLVCFFIFDEKLFVYFSATVAALSAVFFFTDGLFPIIGIDSISHTELIESTLLLIVIGISTLFASNYLSIKEFYPKLNKLAIPIYSIAAFLVSTSWILNDTFIASLANSLLYGLITIYFIAGVLLFSKKNYAKFYVIGTFIPLLFSIDFFVLRNFGIDFLFTEAVHLKIAVLFEVLLLSYAILFRMQSVKEECELKQTKMRIYLKRQDAMSRSQVEQLVEDVYLENLIMQYDLDGLEIKLLQYISEGKPNNKIARKLKLTENEVVEYTKELYQKLEINEQIKEDQRMVANQPDFIYN
jgi:DNA-binding CsgD family transcriptional regulator